MTAPKITVIGGPTAIMEAGGFRLITDPTFDVPGEYVLPYATLKNRWAGLTAEQVLPLDAVLLSHDQLSDNLDNSGRMLLGKAARTFTTIASAKRLGGSSEGLALSTSPASPSGLMGLPRSPAVFAWVSSFCLPAPRRSAGRFTSPSTPTTRLRSHMLFRML